MIILKSTSQIDGIRKSCQIVSYVLSNLEKEVKPNISTKYLNDLAEDLCYGKGGTPGFKGYRGFPYSICASVNSEIVHGFPNNNKLKKGDILSIDFGVLYKGWYGDSTLTVRIGKVSKQKYELVKAGQECLNIGISMAKPFNRIGDISNAIQTHAESKGYKIIKEFVGHGIGRNLHEDPQVPNFGNSGSGDLIKPGLVMAIEPMLVIGSDKIKTLDNNWTAVTEDGGPAVHVEHTISIGDYSTEILTNRN